MDEFSKWLKGKIGESNLGINQVAKFAGVNSATISLALRNKRVPKPTTVIKLARYFKTDPDNLLVLAGHREVFEPEKELHRISNPELRAWLTVENINSLPNPIQRSIVALIKIGLEVDQVEPH